MTVAFWMRFIPWTAISLGVAVAIALGVGAFAPGIGDAIARISAFVALTIGWNAARELTNEEIDQWSVSQVLPVRRLTFYFRQNGQILGPDTLEDIWCRFPDADGVEVIEAAGQSLSELRRSTWIPLSSFSRVGIAPVSVTERSV